MSRGGRDGGLRGLPPDRSVTLNHTIWRRWHRADWCISTVWIVTVTNRARNVWGDESRVLLKREWSEHSFDIVRIGSKNGWNQIRVQDKFQSWRDRPMKIQNIKPSPKSGMLKFRTRLGKKLGICMSRGGRQVCLLPCGSPWAMECAMVGENQLLVQ